MMNTLLFRCKSLLWRHCKFLQYIFDRVIAFRAYIACNRKLCYMTSFLRPYPDFLVIGAQKAGTTTLYHYLRQHPSVKSSSFRKELHFFDKESVQGRYMYRSYFPIKLTKYTKVFEATPSYLFDSRVPRHIHYILPKRILKRLKLIVLLRNPVDRAFSSYHHQLRHGNEKYDFDQALARESQRISISDIDSRRYSYVTRGYYYMQIIKWLEYFDINQFLFIRSEDFFENIQLVVDQVFDFIGVKSYPIDNTGNVNPGNYDTVMDENIKRRLEIIFEAPNDQLKKLLGISWDY